MDGAGGTDEEGGDQGGDERDDERGAPVIAVCGLAFEAAIAAGRRVVPLAGPGPARIAAQLDALLSGPEQDWAGVMSFGCAAGLDPALAPGTCVLAAGVYTPAWRLAADADWLDVLRERLPQARAGWLAGVDAPLVAPADKARLRQASGAVVADMESHAAALAARRHGLPFAACRVVLDPAWRSVPPSALAGVQDDGRTAWLALLRSLAGEPRQLGAMRALARDAWRARRTLRRVRARLGVALAAPPY